MRAVIGGDDDHTVVRQAGGGDGFFDNLERGVAIFQGLDFLGGIRAEFVPDRVRIVEVNETEIGLQRGDLGREGFRHRQALSSGRGQTNASRLPGSSRCLNFSLPTNMAVIQAALLGEAENRARTVIGPFSG